MIETVFARQADFYNRAWFSKSRADLFALFGTYAASLGLDATAFAAQMNNGTLTDAVEAGVAYGISRGVHFTPSFFVNDVPAAQPDSTWSLQQWTAFLDPLFQ
jgi:2-hydroxychromene-2-carboxylate isomerase